MEKKRRGRRKKNILVRTTQKIKSRISHLINFARLTKRTMGWATHHHPLLPVEIASSTTSLPQCDRHHHHRDAGKPPSPPPHFVIKEVKNFDPQNRRRNGGGFALSPESPKKRGESRSQGEIGLALCDSNVDIYFDFSFECRT